MASFKEISLFLTKSTKALFEEIIPSLDEVSITAGISCTLFSLIKVATAWLQIITSQTGINPPRILGINLWEIMPKRDPAN